MQSARRRLPRALSAAVLLSVASCGVEERRTLEGERDAAKRDATRMSDRVHALEQEGAKDRALLLDYRRKAEDADAMRVKVAAIEHEKETQKDELDKITAHRDELKQWIDEELLPLAEKEDPRLVNLRDAAKDMAAEVEKIRGLKWKHPFMRRLISREKMGEWMRDDVKKEMTPEEIVKEVDVGAVFGLCKPGLDMAQIVGQFAEAGVAAFYKCETQTFYHVAGNDGRGARPIVFHELVHALDDQYFDLDALEHSSKDDNDRSLAIKGLVEGSAAFHQGIYEKEHPDDAKEMIRSQMTGDMMAKQLKMAMDVPPVLIASIGMYPYNNAKTFVGKIGGGDAARMERLFRDPPVSTEQVLHPEKFPLDGPRDYPHIIAAPDLSSALGDAWEKVAEDDLGELTIGVLLAQLQQKVNLMTLLAVTDMRTQGLGFKPPIKDAVEGWDGDRYSAWREKSTKRICVVWTSVWDSEKDAVEFFNLYSLLLGKKVLGTQPKEAPTPVRYADTTGRVSAIERSGTRVVTVLDGPADRVDALVDAGMKTSVKADPRDANDK